MKVLLFFLKLSLFAAVFLMQKSIAQEPLNYVVQPTVKSYFKLRNPLIKTTKAIEVLVVNGEAYLEGDISLGSTADLDRFQTMLQAQAVVADDNFATARWTNSIVPFEILDGFTTVETQTILKAMNHIASATNVCFRRRSTEGNYIKFKKYTTTALGFSGGSSWLGRCSFCLDGQEIKLSSVTDAVVRHEIGHALGLLHEQSREDRNNFVEIIKTNIKPGFENQFDQSIYTSTDAGSYDFNSIMHYFSTAFGKTVNGEKAQTIRRRSNPADESFGRSSVLSAGDIQGINSMYTSAPPCLTLEVLAPGELGVGQSKTVSVYANKTKNITGIFMRQNQTFTFTTTSPEWNNGSRETTCNGYAGSLLDGARRHNDLNMMALVGEIFSDLSASTYTGTYFRIGCSRTFTVPKTGYLVAFANDMLLAYGDNSRLVTLTVTRTQ